MFLFWLSNNFIRSRVIMNEEAKNIWLSKQEVYLNKAVQDQKVWRDYSISSAAVWKETKKGKGQASLVVETASARYA